MAGLKAEGLITSHKGFLHRIWNTIMRFYNVGRIKGGGWMRKGFLCNYGMGHSQDEDSDIRGESGGEGVRVYTRGFFLRMGEGE